MNGAESLQITLRICDVQHVVVVIGNREAKSEAQEVQECELPKQWSVDEVVERLQAKRSPWSLFVADLDLAAGDLSEMSPEISRWPAPNLPVLTRTMAQTHEHEQPTP